GAAAIYGKVSHGAMADAMREALLALAREAIGSGDRLMFPRWLGDSGDLDVSFVSELHGARPDLDIESEAKRAVEPQRPSRRLCMARRSGRARFSRCSMSSTEHAAR